jgi:hypothetical protein
MKTCLTLLLFVPLMYAQTPDKMKKTEDDIRQEMIKISRQLGVTCTECHVTKNFRSNDKLSFKVSLAHMKIVDMLRQTGLSGKNGEPEASCYTCHRGQLKFDHKEKFDDHYRFEPKKKAPSTKAEVVDDVPEKNTEKESD